MQATSSLMRLVGRPVGVSFFNGQGTSGVFCGVRDNKLLLIEYAYQDNFPLKQYPLNELRNVMPFPSCQRIPSPPRPPEPPMPPRPPRPPRPPHWVY